MSTIELFDYQREGVKFLLGGKRRLLADTMGLGKTIQVISAIKELGKSNILVICPASLIPMWEGKLAEMLPDCMTVRLADHKKPIQLSGKYRIALVSYNYIQKDKGVDRLLRNRWSAIVCDEAHAIKNWRSKTCKGLMQILDNHNGYLWMLTGTPATRSGLDYYPYCNFLGGERRKLTAFGDEYCEAEYNPWSHKFDYKGVKLQKAKQLREYMRQFTLRRRKEEVLTQLPPKTYQDIPCEVPADVVAECLNVGEGLIKKCIENDMPLPAHIMKALTAVGMAKVDAAVELCLGSDEPIVIMTTHNDVVEAMCERLDCKLRVTGSESADAKAAAVAAFQAGESKYIVCNVQAGGVGITLTRASVMLFVEIPWSPAVLRQAEDRIHRIGATRPCQIIRLVGINTLDKDILDAIAYKERFINAVNN